MRRLFFAVVIAVLALGVQVPSGAQQIPECSAGMVVAPGESCLYPGTSVEFSVDAGGQGRILFFSAGASLNLRSTINGVLYHFVASKQADGTWVIEAVAGTARQDDDGDDEDGDEEEELSGVVLAVANGSSLSDVGTAASLVAASVGEEVLFAESADALGSEAAAAVHSRTPQWVVLVGGTAALGEGIREELGRLAPGVRIKRLAGSDRVDTAARAARLAIGRRSSVSAVIANGWSLSDVGTAASAVASGAGDVVLYAGRDDLGAPTAEVLADYQFASVSIVGGVAALSDAVKSQIQRAAGGATVSRQGGSTRVHTAALFAESAFEAGADHAVIANGWSLPDVGRAAALAAADRDSAVLYTDRGEIGQPTAAIITEYQPDHITLVGSLDAIPDRVHAALASLARMADIRRTHTTSDEVAEDDEANRPPAFTTPASHTLAENRSGYFTVSAVDHDAADSLTGITITGGADRVKFTLSPPRPWQDQDVYSLRLQPGSDVFDDADYENPADADGDNIYEVTVTATSGTGSRVRTASQAITVEVTNVVEVARRPTEPDVSSTTETSVTVVWDRPYITGGEITRYDVQYRAQGTPAWLDWTHADADRSATIAGLTANTDYDVRVRAISPEGASEWSSPVWATAATGQPPPRPRNVRWTQIGTSESVSVTWNTSTEATYYRLYHCSTIAQGVSCTLRLTASRISGTEYIHEVSAAGFGTTYVSYAVSACNGMGCSMRSRAL